MSVTVTLHLWWLGAYLAVGVVLFLPCNWWAWRRKSIGHPDFSFWRTLWANIRREHGWPIVLQVIAWPLALWEDIR